MHTRALPLFSNDKSSQRHWIKRKIMKIKSAILTSVCFILICALPSLAQQKGQWVPGQFGLNAGVIPNPGITYANLAVNYSASQLNDSNGNRLLQNVTGTYAFWVDENILYYVPNHKILGGYFMPYISINVANGSQAADLAPLLPGVGSGFNLSSGGSGFADLYVEPINLGWHFAKRVDFNAGYSFLAPTGRYTAGANNNVGSGYWTHRLSSGQTFYLAREKRLLFSAFQMYEFHTVQEGTGVHPGQTFDLDYSLMGLVHRTAHLALQVGATGYEARQTTARFGPNITPEVSAERYAVNGFGFALSAAFPERKANLGFRFFKEFANRSTFQGYSAQISGAIHF